MKAHHLLSKNLLRRDTSHRASVTSGGQIMIVHCPPSPFQAPTLCFTLHTSQKALIHLYFKHLRAWRVLTNTSPLFTLLPLNLIFADSAVKYCEVFEATLHTRYLLYINLLSAICEVWRVKLRAGPSDSDAKAGICACAQKKLFLRTAANFS